MHRHVAFFILFRRGGDDENRLLLHFYFVFSFFFFLSELPALKTEISSGTTAVGNVYIFFNTFQSA